MNDYIIEYTLKAKDGSVLISGKMRAKNKATKFEAQAKFEKLLKKKYANFGQLIVHKCYVDVPFSDVFGDIFK